MLELYNFFLDIERAFDTISRERLFCKLHQLDIHPQLIQLLSLWHQETNYNLFSNGEESAIPVGKGVRQGCRAAPLLWNGYMWLFLVELSQVVSPTWVLQCMNVYADDCQMGDLFESQTELQQLICNIQKTLQLLTKFGLTINPAKCTALLTMGGTAHRRARQRITTWKDGKEWLCLGTTDAPLWIPIARNAKYLGTIISYQKSEDATVHHRIQLARVAFGRLQRWLTGKRGLTRAQRLHLFSTCVYPVMTYGIFSIGLTFAGINKLQVQMYQMLRKILHNHAYITGHNHEHALNLNRVELPVEWLWRSAETLQRSIHKRNLNAGPQDLVQHVDWSNLTTIFDLLHAQRCGGPAHLILDPDLDIAGTTRCYQCTRCSFQTDNVATFRRHCTTEHDTRMNRTIPVKTTKYMQNGLPQCKFCHQKFTTWRTFTMHVQRGCQAVQPGPRECWQASSQPLISDPTQQHNMFAPKQDAPIRGRQMLTQADLQNVASQEWGPRVLTIVGNRHWHHMKKETDACQYLATRCCICDQYLGRTQELHRHYKLHHPEYWTHVRTKGHQLTNLYGEDPPCPYCGELFKANHQCTVWLQLAMLLVYGGGATSDLPSQAMPVTRRCEICDDTFATDEALHEHLIQTHRLKSSSYNPARDSLAGEPVCNHCNTMYDCMESLRSHINQGRCLKFNPQLPTEVVDVLPQWVDANVSWQIGNHSQRSPCASSTDTEMPKLQKPLPACIRPLRPLTGCPCSAMV